MEGKEYFQTTADVDAQVCFRSQMLTCCDLTIKQAFRTDDGIPVEDTTIRLSLRDFATDPLLEQFADINQEVVITAQQLCAFLQSAEARQSAQIHHGGSVNAIRPGVLKRRRRTAPSDATGSDDEPTSERGRSADGVIVSITPVRYLGSLRFRRDDVFLRGHAWEDQGLVKRPS